MNFWCFLFTPGRNSRGGGGGYRRREGYRRWEEQKDRGWGATEGWGGLGFRVCLGLFQITIEGLGWPPHPLLYFTYSKIPFSYRQIPI